MTEHVRTILGPEFGLQKCLQLRSLAKHLHPASWNIQELGIKMFSPETHGAWYLGHEASRIQETSRIQHTGRKRVPTVRKSWHTPNPRTPWPKRRLLVPIRIVPFPFFNELSTLCPHAQNRRKHCKLCFTAYNNIFITLLR